jgi:hypothetical protein
MANSLLRQVLFSAASYLFLGPGVYAQCPVAPACVPGPASSPQAAAFGMGIYGVTLNTINTTTNGAVDGSPDYSCTTSTTLAPGAAYTIRVATNAAADENVRVWLDYDNNGSFDPTTELLFASSNARVHSGTTALIPLSAVTGVPLRLRIAADASVAPVPTPCSTPVYSQTEDYGVVLQANTQAPQAAFVVSAAQACAGTFAFTDQSTRGASSWLWRFGDGTTSTQQHPTHTYAAPGSYDVKLRACNSLGCDSVLVVAAAQWAAPLAVPAACSPAPQSYCCNYGITQVSFAGQAQASADGVAGYEDFTCRRRFQGQQGQRYPLQITTGGANRYDVRVYIDYDNNGIFDERTEVVFEALSTQNPTGFVTLAGPVAAAGPVRLRVTAAATGLPLTACTSPVLGQVEDYSLLLTPAACSSAPAPGVVVGPAAICPNVPFRLGLSATIPPATGLQWQSSPDSLTWTNLVGANNQLLDLRDVNAAAYYRALTVCGSTVRATPAFRVLMDPLLCYCNQLFTGSTGNCGPSVNRLVRLWVPSTTLDYAGPPCTTSPDSMYQRVVPYAVNRTAALQRNGTYQLQARTTLGASLDAWLDVDHSGTYDPSEYLLLPNAATAGAPQRVQFTVPATAPLGPTGLRLRWTTNIPGPTTACRTATTGQVFDFTVLLTEPGCAAPLAQGQVQGVRAYCPDSLLTLRVIGQSNGTALQWQSSPDSLSWTDLPGATARVLTYRFPDTTYVRLRTSCGPVSVATAAVRLQPNLLGCICTPTPITTPCSTPPVPLTRIRIGNTPINAGGTACERGSTWKYTATPAGLTGPPVATLRRGVAYPVRLTLPANQPNLCVLARAWLDYNHDGHFTDDEATWLRSSATFNGFCSPSVDSVATLTVPPNAALGPLTMRILIRPNSTNQVPMSARVQCQDFNAGELRDFIVTIAAAQPTPNGPVAGTITGPTRLCPGRAVHLSATGHSVGAALQWESQSAGGSWQAIAGATGATLVRPFAAATSYRLTATADGQTATSAPWAVAVGPCGCQPLGNCQPHLTYFALHSAGAALQTTPDFRVPPCRTYSDYARSTADSLTTTLYRGDSAQVVLRGTGGYLLPALWLDANGNGRFEASEFHNLLPNYAVNAPMFVRVPANAARGPVLMRLRIASNGVDPAFVATDTCRGRQSRGETYDFTVTLADRCPAAPSLLHLTLPGGGGQLAAAGTWPAGTTWLWHGPNGFTSTAARPSLPLTAAAGTYYCTIRSSISCQLTAAREVDPARPSTALAARPAVAAEAELYPNPSPGTSKLRLATPAEAGSAVTVYDMTGRMVLTQALKSGATEVQLQLPATIPGLYVVILRTSTGTVMRRWMVE